MSKQLKIIKLLDLLGSRRVVNMKTIMEELDIPKRTAFRYITSLKDAGIPVEYDDQAHGYVLGGRKPPQKQTFDLSVHQALMVVIAMNLAKCQVNEVYREHIDEVLQKLTDSLPASIEDIVSKLQIGEHEQTSGDQSPAFTKLLVEAAIIMERSIDASYSVSKKTLRHTFLQPSLTFQGNWHLRDSKQQKVQVPIEAVQTVQVK